VFLRSLKLTNLLSFGPDSEPIPLGPLNVLIGPNGSGKSNIIEALGLLRALPTDVLPVLYRGGGSVEWLWKGHGTPVEEDEELAPASVSVDVEGRSEERAQPLKYHLGLGGLDRRAVRIQERLERIPPLLSSNEPPLLYGVAVSSPGGRTVLRTGEQLRVIEPEELHPQKSIFAQRKDPGLYPELTWLGEAFQQIGLYRDWRFGPHSPFRIPQPADAPNQFLLEDGSNLGLVLNKIRKTPERKAELLSLVQRFLEGVSDVDVDVTGGSVQVFLQERDWVIPAPRLSDGTLRWLALLAILLNPSPQRLICIEEPELGLHPDLLPVLADLLRKASERTQVLITTHSDILVDALNETPESVLVCEKREGATRVRRLEREQLKDWLEKYTLGELWRSGELGGTRW
jgi:predicted ATPase